MLAQLAGHLLPKPEPSTRRLVRAIHDATAGDWFVAGDLWRMAEAERVQAQSSGDEVSELSNALGAACITSAHGLGRWITAEAWAFKRGGVERGGVQWRVAVSAVSETVETASPI
ncbi:hypothetical protein I5535_11395 [Rhodobacteraceae bacterium F11138]|nr:hypothetical protein [Rhodobacteraceae bacterium F11138]